MKMICFDMDGTLADLYNEPDWLSYLMNEDVTPYINAKPMWDMDALREVLLKLRDKGWEIRVITWLAKDSSEEYKKAVRQAKKEWLERYNFPLDACHMVAYGRTKAECIRRWVKGEEAILIDDSQKVRDGWHLGETIDPISCGDLPEYLSKYLNEGV